jgi:hypothetical protein
MINAQQTTQLNNERGFPRSHIAMYGPYPVVLPFFPQLLSHLRQMIKAIFLVHFPKIQAAKSFNTGLSR